MAYNECVANADHPEYADIRLARVKSWPKHQHLESIRRSGCFRIARESTFHKVELGDTERLVGLARSQGSVSALLKAAISEDAIGLVELRRTCHRLLDIYQYLRFW